MPAELTVDSPDAAASLGQRLYEFDAGTRRRGAQYHRHGRVFKLERGSEHHVEAMVHGGMRYRVVLTRDAAGWSGRCSCPIGWNCKHVFATALAWIAHLSKTTGAADSVYSSPSPPVPLTFRQQWEPILADKLGRKLTPDEGAFLGKLSAVFNNFRYSGRMSRHSLDQLGFATNESRRPAFEDPYQGWWSVPPRDPLELWQYIAYDIETSGLVVPAFLRPITDTTLVRSQTQERLRQAAIRRWKDRFNSLAVAANTLATQIVAPAEPEWLDLRLCIGGSKSVLEIRSRPEAPWKPAPRAFLERFAHTNPGDLTAVDASPAVFAFLAICQDHGRHRYGRIALDDFSFPELLHRLLSHPLARTLVVDATRGTPIESAPDPLNWEVARRDDERDYEISLRLPGGQPLPPSALHLPGNPDLYLHDGKCYRGPPALDGASAATAVVPAEIVEGTDVLRTLRRFGSKLPPEIEARFVCVPLRARIECALAHDQMNNEFLELKLAAISDQPPLEYVWSPNGWQLASKSEADDARGGKIHDLDFAAADLLPARLRVLNLVYSTYPRARWTHRLTRAFPEEFLAWREALPAAVEVLATGELATLLGGPVRAHVDFQLIETEVHRDWFDLALALKPEDTTLTPEEIALLLRARGKLVRLPGKGWRRLTVQLDGAPAEALAAAGFDLDSAAEAALAGERQRFHALQLAPTAVADLLPERQADALRARVREIVTPAAPELPAGLRAELRPYQREGFRFLTFLSANQLGGVLADDMGLGKTVQTLAWLLWLAEQDGGRKQSSADKPGKSALPKGRSNFRALVVCPKSVMGNWEAETARFAPSLKTVRFAPALADSPFAAPDSAIVVANYAQLRINAEYFKAQRWHAVVLDEGQFIKTPGSKVAQVARDLPGEHRLVLTGTPIENRLLDLWSLFAFALPGLLGSQASFKRHYAQDNPLALTRLRTRVRHFLLRRTKTQVAADLPARTEEDVVVELEGEQAKLYQAELKRARAELLKVKTAREFEQSRFNILASLLRLRQICCHPALADSAHRDTPAAKLDELMERVEELRDEGHQVLVFSQFVEMLELVRTRIAAAGIEHLMLTGQTENREALVKQFQSEKGITVFLLSLKAAGFGLNLTAASYVILCDPWWNPAVEAQAIDRTHRIGQSAPVIAYRLIARGTIEEKIRALQREKAALAATVVQEESLAQVMDLDSLRQILG